MVTSDSCESAFVDVVGRFEVIEDFLAKNLELAPTVSQRTLLAVVADIGPYCR
jgi:hypothetical protein